MRSNVKKVITKWLGQYRAAYMAHKMTVEVVEALGKDYEWKPVKGSHLESNTLYLVSNIEDEWVCAGQKDKGKWYNQFSDEQIRPTHYALMPPPPKRDL